MTRNSILSDINHPKSALSQLKKMEGLPFHEVLSSEIIKESIETLEYRDRVFSPDITLWTFLSQVLDDDQSQQAAVARVIAFFLSQGQKPPSANTSAYSQARSRLPEDLLISLTKKSALILEGASHPNWKWKGKAVKLIDGSTVSMPDTVENQNVYPQPSFQKKGIGFPLARILSVTSFSTGAVLNLAIDAYSGKGTGEHSLLRKIIDTFEPGDIALGDAYYPSFFLLAMLIQCGVDAVFPIHSSRIRDFRRGKRNGKKDHTVQWKKPYKPDWMTQEFYQEFPDTITMREVAVTNNRPGFRSKSRVLVTTLLDTKKISKQDLAELYDYRWLIELDLRSIKETMHMGILRGKTPEIVRKEIWAHLLAYNLIRKIMAQAAVLRDVKPRELSFRLAVQMINSFRGAGLLLEYDQDVYLNLLIAIGYKKIGKRPNRQEPRMVKRRPKAFGWLKKPRNYYRRKTA